MLHKLKFFPRYLCKLLISPQKIIKIFLRKFFLLSFDCQLFLFKFLKSFDLSYFGCAVEHIKELLFWFCYVFGSSAWYIKYLEINFGWKVHYFSSCSSFSCLLVFSSSFFALAGGRNSSCLALSAICLDFLLIAGAKGIFLIYYCFFYYK